MIRKAMILSAGLGTRLSPITDKIPKPLVPVLNLPNIIYAIELLRRAGISEIIINLHHLADQIREYLGSGENLGLSIEYSYESTLLGTGGGIKNVEHFFIKQPFIVVNCDFVCDFDLRPAIKRHLDRRAVGTMCLIPKTESYTPVFYSDNGLLQSIGKGSGQSATFTGIHIMAPETLDYLQPVFSGVNNELYPALIAENQAFCDFCTGSWWDTGDIPNLFKSSIDLLSRLHSSETLRATIERNLDYSEKAPGVWLPAGQKAPANVEFKAPTIVASPHAIAGGSIIGPNVILGADTVVESPCTVENSVTMGANRISDDIRNTLLYEGRCLTNKKGL